MSGSSSLSIDGAQKRNIFDRHDRRQAIGPPGPAVPTKAALARANRGRGKPLDVPSWLASTAHAPDPPGPGAPKAASVRTGTSSPSSEGMPASLQLRSPWTAGVRLGDLVQGGERMTLCVAEAGDKGVVMLKRLAKREGVDEMRVLQQIRHPNIIHLKQAFLDGESIYLGLEYHRYTLGELLCVHIDLDEPAIQYIARSVFEALRCVTAAGFLHWRVGLQSIRVSHRNAQVVLTNFGGCTVIPPTGLPNRDLEDLGLVVLECMDGKPREAGRDAAYVREQRASNRVFGLRDAERWSGHKQLVDFLDELFNAEKPASAKLERPHGFVTENDCSQRHLLPYAELVGMECFTLWEAAKGSSQH